MTSISGIGFNKKWKIVLCIILYVFEKVQVLFNARFHDKAKELCLSQKEYQESEEIRREELKSLQEALALSESRYRQMAYHDTLTGMPNCKWLAERLQESFEKENASGILFQVEIRNLKTVNDIFGHASGDEVLRQLADAMRDLIGAKGIIVRSGGQQFILLLQGAWSEDVSMTIARGLLQIFDAPFRMSVDKVYLSGVVGVASYPQHGSCAEEILKNLDIALNHAKEERQRGYSFFNDDLRREAEDRLRLVSDLHEALPKEEFQLFYQPKVCAFDNRVIGFEALLRWNSEKNGLVMPGKFIPIAEQSGMIVQIGAWVLQEACVFAGRLKDAGYEDIHIAVNISPRQLMQEDFVQQVMAIIEITQVDLKCLEIEITESIAIEEFNQNVGKLKSLRELGLKISLDDFGTGYSSLTYLKRLPINTLKLDREFIRDMSEQESEKIIGALIKLAHEMGLKVIAEGVEVEWQAEFLKLKGCDQLQGYLFSRPIPEAAAFDILRNRV